MARERFVADPLRLVSIASRARPYCYRNNGLYTDAARARDRVTK